MDSDVSDELFTVVENADEGRFELRREGVLVGFATFSHHGGTIVVPHVETFLPHRGQGYADRLMAGMLDDLRSTGRKIVPVCPFADDYIERHPAVQDLLATP